MIEEGDSYHYSDIPPAVVEKITARVMRETSDRMELNDMLRRYCLAIEHARNGGIVITKKLALSYADRIFDVKQDEIDKARNVHLRELRTKQEDPYITLTGLKVTAIGLAFDLYYLAIVAENMPRVRIEANCMTIPALTLTLAPLAVSAWRYFQSRRE